MVSSLTHLIFLAKFHPCSRVERAEQRSALSRSLGSLCKNYTTSSHAPTSHAPSSHAPSSHAPILHRINSRIHIHLPLPIQEPLPFLRLGCSKLASTSNHHSFFYRLFRKVYATSNHHSVLLSFV